jgi:endonuclease/exonuclease/phosphatase family metal-dependent hydrolase
LVDPAPAGSTKPGPAVTVVNLNAAMGYRIEAGNPAGTDATPEDLADLADDILSRGADIANLQEMAKPAALELQAILAARTGHEWQLNWAHSGTATYYPGKEKDEAPSPGYRDVSAGNAQLVRIGDGVRSQQPITLDGEHDDQGILLPSGGRSFAGAQITTEHGVVDVYVTHLAREKDASDEVRARDVHRLQEFTESRTNPAVVTGDFNQTVDYVRGQPYPNYRTVDALRSFMDTHGYTDLARDEGPTSNQKAEPWERPALTPLRIDYILARGVRTRDTARFESHQSDHWGLVTTIDPG